MFCTSSSFFDRAIRHDCNHRSLRLVCSYTLVYLVQPRMTLNLEISWLFFCFSKVAMASPPDGVDPGAPPSEALAVDALLQNFARDHAMSLVPTKVKGGQLSEAGYQRDETHRASCDGQSCSRCYFENGFFGRLRSGAGRVMPPQKRFSWCHRFTFEHPAQGRKCWLTVRPYTWGSWGIGCWVCNNAGGRKAFGEVNVTDSTTLQPSSFEKHQASNQHQDALKLLSGEGQSAQKPPDGVFSGVCDAVPRIDKFFLAGTIVSRHSSFTDFESFSNTHALGSSMGQGGGDSSRKACAKMVVSMAQPLYEQDRRAIAEAPGLHYVYFYLCIRYTARLLSTL